MSFAHADEAGIGVANLIHASSNPEEAELEIKTSICFQKRSMIILLCTIRLPVNYYTYICWRFPSVAIHFSDSYLLLLLSLL